MANIQSIKVLRNTSGLIVYVNLDNGTFNTYTKKDGVIRWNGTPELLAEAKQLAIVDHKFQNWTAPRKESKFVSDKPLRCPDCGSYTCGANCQSNMWSK